MFGWKRPGVATPTLTPPERPDDGRETGDTPQLKPAHRLTPTSELERQVIDLVDEILWLKERFGKLQSRVTAELREIRREQDRLYEEEPDDEDER